jgi:hypothetical protein
VVADRRRRLLRLPRVERHRGRHQRRRCGRQVLVDRIAWEADGWPRIRDGTPSRSLSPGLPASDSESCETPPRVVRWVAQWTRLASRSRSWPSPRPPAPRAGGGLVTSAGVRREMSVAGASVRSYAATGSSTRFASSRSRARSAS